MSTTAPPPTTPPGEPGPTGGSTRAPAGTSTPQAAGPSRPSEAALAAQQRDERARSRARQGVADIVRSMLAVLAVVAVVVLVFARPQGPIERPVDLAGSVADARAAGLDVAAPRLPAGWRPTGARFAPDTAEGLPTWHVGYLTPDDTYAGVDVTRGATPAWVAGVVGDEDAEASGDRDVAGTPWQVWEAPGSSVTGLVHARGDTTTVVSGRASGRQLAVLAAAVTG